MLEIKQKRMRRAPRRTDGMHPAVRVTRNIAITVALILLLFIVGGLVLTWFNGHSGKEVKVATLPKKAAAKAARTPDPTGPIGSSVQFISTPVMPGDNVSITIHTNAFANCQITFEINKTQYKDTALIPKKVDDLGLVSWSWTLPKETPFGKWPVTVVCANLKNSTMSVGQLEVVKTMPSPAVQ